MASPPPSIPYSATDLTLIIGACASAVVGIIAGIRLSRCTHIKCGNCIEITKEPPGTKDSPNTKDPSTTKDLPNNKAEPITSNKDNLLSSSTGSSRTPSEVTLKSDESILLV
jgi:hypothetical protein